MAMERERHEELLNELLNPELEQSRRTEILQELRTDYAAVHSELKELTETRDKLQKDNDDLVISNSQLFRQIGVLGNEKKEEEQQQKEFSETITLEEIESRQ